VGLDDGQASDTRGRILLWRSFGQAAPQDVPRDSVRGCRLADLDPTVLEAPSDRRRQPTGGQPQRGPLEPAPRTGSTAGDIGRRGIVRQLGERRRTGEVRECTTRVPATYDYDAESSPADLVESEIPVLQLHGGGHVAAAHEK